MPAVVRPARSQPRQSGSGSADVAALDDGLYEKIERARHIGAPASWLVEITQTGRPWIP